MHPGKGPLARRVDGGGRAFCWIRGRAEAAGRASRTQAPASALRAGLTTDKDEAQRGRVARLRAQLRPGWGTLYPGLRGPGHVPRGTEPSRQTSPSSGSHPVSAFSSWRSRGPSLGLHHTQTPSGSFQNTDLQTIPVLNSVSTVRARGQSVALRCVHSEASPFLNQTENPSTKRVSRDRGQTLLWSTHNGTDGDASGFVDGPCPRQTTFPGLSLPTWALESQDRLSPRTNTFHNFGPSASWFPYKVGRRWPRDAMTPAVPTPVSPSPASSRLGGGLTSQTARPWHTRMLQALPGDSGKQSQLMGTR